MSTLLSVGEISEREFVEHLDEVLRRVMAGEEITLITADGEAIEIARHRPTSVGWDEFWKWPKADRGMFDVLHDIRGDGTDDWQDPWERYEATR